MCKMEFILALEDRLEDIASCLIYETKLDDGVIKALRKINTINHDLVLPYVTNDTTNTVSGGHKDLQGGYNG